MTGTSIVKNLGRGDRTFDRSRYVPYLTAMQVDTRVLHCVALLQIIVLHLKYAHILYIVLHGRH